MDGNVSYLVSDCNELAQNKYKKLRHDKVKHCFTGIGARLTDLRHMRSIFQLIKEWMEMLAI